MNVKELRIGFWYNYKGEPQQMNEGTLMWILQLGGEYNFDPIPLTEEWLTKFGFEKPKNPSMGWENSYSLNAIVINEGIIYPDNDMETPPLRLFPKHVHSLQNLYFALTGTELTIK